MNFRKDVEPIDVENASHRIYALCHVGHVRHENQDFMGVFERDDQLLFIVSDGMGGHHGGFEASRMAVAELGRHFMECEERSPKSLLCQGILNAHNALQGFAVENPEMEGMGATVVAAIIVENRVWIAHLGDSRAHVLRGDDVRQLTIDHTAINSLALSGDLDPEALANHPYGHILDRSLGGEGGANTEIREDVILLQAGDRLILSTDGYWQSASDEDVRRDLSISSLTEAVEAALSHALECGGSDNITIGVLEARGGEETPLPADVREDFLSRAHERYRENRIVPPPVRTDEEPRPRPRPHWRWGILFAVVLGGIIAFFMSN